MSRRANDQEDEGPTRAVQFVTVGDRSQLPAPLLRVSTCGLLTVDVATEVVGSDPPLARYISLTPEQLRGRGTAPALLLLKLLLSRPERFALRDWLMEQFCHDRELFSSVRLDNIVSQLRSLLCPPAYEELRTHLVAHVRGSVRSGDGYQLAAYPLIWTDIDALTCNVEQAARMERFGDDPLSYWEQAYLLAKRGIYFPDEIYSDWTQARRGEVAGMLRQSVQALARLSLARYGESGEEEVLQLLRSYWQEHPREEDVLRPLMELLGRRERYQEALEYYGQLVTLLQADGCQPGAQIQDVAAYVRTKQLQRSSPRRGANTGTPLGVQADTSLLMVRKEQQTLLSETLAPEPPWPDENMLTLDESGSDATYSNYPHRMSSRLIPVEQGQAMNRQEFLHGTARAFGATLLAPSHDTLGSDILERFFLAMEKPSTIDQTTLAYFQKRTENYYRERHDATVLSTDVLSYTLDHLHKVTALLEGPLLPTMRTSLCSIAAEVAQLVGELHFEVGHYTKAGDFHKATILAAREANNQTLEAVALGWLSFSLSYSKNTKEALTCIQQARQLAARSNNSTVLAWLAAIEAEIWASLDDLHACRKALDEAACVNRQADPKGNGYWIHFDQSLLLGYKGVCFLKLYRSGKEQRATLAREAQKALLGAVTGLDPALMRRQPTYLLDLARAYMLEGEFGQACQYALQSLERVAQIKSQMVLDRLFSLRKEMEPWASTQEVKTLDEQMTLLLLPPGQH